MQPTQPLKKITRFPSPLTPPSPSLNSIGAGPGLGEKVEAAEGYLSHAQLGQPMGTHATMAQVHPRRLTEALAAASGAEIVKATVTGIDRDPTTGVVTAVTLSAAVDANGSGSSSSSSSSSLRCDAVVFAMGAWARDVVNWFPAVEDVALLKRSVGPKYTSVVSW